jgi:hypothetical protein
VFYGYYSKQRLFFFIIEVKSVYCVVRTGSLFKKAHVFHACHATLHKNKFNNFRQNAALPTRSKFRHDTVLQTKKPAQTLNFVPLLHTAYCPACCLPHFPILPTLFTAYPNQKDDRSLPGNLQSSKLFCFPPGIVVNVVLLTDPPSQWVPGFFPGGGGGVA